MVPPLEYGDKYERPERPNLTFRCKSLDRGRQGSVADASSRPLTTSPAVERQFEISAFRDSNPGVRTQASDRRTYAWLPLFAFSVVVLRVGGWTLKSVKMAQWFLRAGKQHPLHAIGLVASASVFIGITLGRLLVK